MTVLTDYGLAAVGGGLGARLWSGAEGQLSRRLWAAAFVAVALAAIAGGTSHGLAPRLDEASAAALWRVTYGLVGLGNVFILAGAAVAAARGGVRAGLIAAIVLRFGVWFAFICGRPDFRYVVYDYAGTLLGLLLLAVCLARRGRPGAPWVAAGVLASLAGAVVQRSGLDPSPAFNHNDLFHVVQAAGLYLYFRGGRLFADAAHGK
jgi:Family of unknown function (DUF6962)